MQKAKCTSCGAEFEVDEKQEAVVCKECKNPVIVASAIENYKDSLEPNTPIFKNQEYNDKVKFRIRFSLIVILIMTCIMGSFFVTSLVEEIYNVVHGLNNSRAETDWIFSMLKMILSFVGFFILVASIKPVLELKDKFKYNKKKDFNSSVKDAFFWSTLIFSFNVVFFIIYLVELLIVKKLIFVSYIIIPPLAYLVLAGIMVKFFVDINKMCKNKNT